MPGTSEATRGRRDEDEGYEEDPVAMPHMRATRVKENQPIAITFGDLHFTATPPAFRSAEPDWYKTQLGYIEQIRCLKDKYPKAVLVCTGDVFDDGWRERRCPPELINFLIKNLPKCYAIPGQHDLPHHNYSDLEKSAYWTLCQAGVIENLGHMWHAVNDDLVLHGFPWGFTPLPCPPNVKKKYPNAIHLAVIHAYCWMTGHSFPGCPQEAHVNEWWTRLRGFNAAVFGDNHSGFVSGPGVQDTGPEVFNGGTFMIRRSDEITYEPRVGLLYRDPDRVCRWRIHKLDQSRNKYLDVSGNYRVDKHTMVNTREVVEVLNELGASSLDFKEALLRAIKKTSLSPGARTVILAALEQGD